MVYGARTRRPKAIILYKTELNLPIKSETIETPKYHIATLKLFSLNLKQ